MKAQTVSEWLAAGHEMTRCPTVFLVPSPQGYKDLPKALPKRKRKVSNGGAWAKYWAKRRAQMGASNG